MQKLNARRVGRVPAWIAAASCLSGLAYLSSPAVALAQASAEGWRICSQPPTTIFANSKFNIDV